MGLQFPKSAGHWRSWLVTIPAASLVTGVLVSVALITSIAAWQRFMYRLWSRVVLAIYGAHVRVVGAENLDPARNYVLASNHMSLADTPVLFGHMPIPFKILAKRELLRVPFIGWYLDRAGHLTVSRGSIRSAIESMNDAARLVREKHLSVLIFPEGTRSLEGVGTFKDGAAYLAIAAGVPIVPVALAGTNRILPAKSSYIQPGDVELRIGQPIETAGMRLKDRAGLTQDVEDRVRSLFECKMGHVGLNGPGGSVPLFRRVLQLCSSIYHAVIGLLLFGIGLFATITRAGTSLKMTMLPLFSGAYLNVWLMTIGVAGVVLALLALNGKLCRVFAVWTTLALLVMLHGYWLSPHLFRNVAEIWNAVWLCLGAMIACFGAWWAVRGTRRA